MMLRAVAAILAVAVAAAIVVTACGSGGHGPNVVLITIETLRNDHVGAPRRNGIELTPTLDKLAADGVRFERTYAAASFTLPSLHTIATGEPPAVHRVRFWTHFGNRYTGPLLAQLFRDADYRAGFVSSGYHPLDAYPMLKNGWDEPPVALNRTDAAEVISAAKSWLDRHDKEPFFLWIHLFEPHEPYGPAVEFVNGLADLGLYQQMGPAPWRVQDWVDRVPGGQGAQLADSLYAADVRAADAAVAQILADLDQRGLMPKTVVCVSSDYGENLSMDPEPRWDHGVSTDEQLIRVPLIFSGQGIAKGKRDATIARHLDLPPTLLALAGIDAPKEWRGRNLFGPAPAPEFAISECTTYEHKDAAEYSVTDGVTSLRAESWTAPWTRTLRDESLRGSEPVPVDASHPLPAAESRIRALKDDVDRSTRRAEQVNEPGADEASTPAQKAIRELGYTGGKK